MPELLWKAYIDFETDEGERDKARALYERLLALSGHVKVWISYALFEATPLPLPRSQREDEDDTVEDVTVVPGDLELARRVFERGYSDLKSKGLKAEVCIDFLQVNGIANLVRLFTQRVALLESWKAFEVANGSDADIVKVQNMFPIVSRKRKVDESGQVVEGTLYFTIVLRHDHMLYRLGHGLR